MTRVVFASTGTVTEIPVSEYQPPAAIGSSSTDANTHTFESPIGLGALVGSSNGQNDYAAVIEGQNHFKQRRGQYGLRQYGQGEARFEIGNGLGLTLSATSGLTLIGLNQNRPFVSPFFGVEPVSGRITWNTNTNHNNYYEWLPMAAAGVQFEMGSCRLLPIARAGGAAGNIVSPGLIPKFGTAIGAGTYLNCLRFDLGAEATQIFTQGQDVPLRIVDVAYSFSPDGLKMGVRGESEPSEDRVLLLIRSKIFY